MGEELDILDCAGRRTGERIGRDEAHRSGTWHGAFHALIVYERQGGSFALFQKRSSTKQIAPGRFDVSVGGHYSAGEGPESAGPREICEELGLRVRFEDLLPLGRRVFVFCFSPDVKELEFQDVFLLPVVTDLSKLVLQPGEVDAVLEVGIAEGIALFSGLKRTAGGTLIGRDGSRVPAAVRADEFVPCVDNYYLKLLQVALRYLDGVRTGLAI